MNNFLRPIHKYFSKVTWASRNTPETILSIPRESAHLTKEWTPHFVHTTLEYSTKHYLSVTLPSLAIFLVLKLMLAHIVLIFTSIGQIGIEGV